MEWFVLVSHDFQILGIFTTLLETLSWKTDQKLEEGIHIQKVRNKDGLFQIQKITISPHIFLKKVEGGTATCIGTLYNGE